MYSEKKKTLEKHFDRIINVGFCLTPYEDLSDIISSNPVVFGTTIDEKILSVEGVDELFKSQFEQMGSLKPELDRNRIATHLSPDGNSAFIVEEFTLSLSSPHDVNTIFIRASCVMEYQENGWKLTHWHASTPVDTENDHWHLEEWKREKEKLQKLVDQQTADLHDKNKELEIEASIERVRAVAMSMSKPEDMLKVCRTISNQLEYFGVEHIRNVQTVIINEEKNIYQNYQYFTPYDKESVEITDCDKNSVVHDMTKRMLESPDAFFTGTMSGQELATFRTYRKQENQFPDPLLDDTEELDYHFFSIGPGGLGITLYQPLNEDGLKIFKRFHNAFSLAYRRFRDIEKAEAQARESEIQLALERVRARTMAMHDSIELQEVAALMYQEFIGLGYGQVAQCGYAIIDVDSSLQKMWLTQFDGNPMTHFDLPLKGDKLLNDRFKAWESGNSLFYQKITGADFAKHLKGVQAGISAEQIEMARKNMPDPIHFYNAHFSHGYLHIVAHSPLNTEQEIILKRFSKVFEQTYTRFLDLQKAEEQAREARIEASLERVRGRAMAIRESDELRELIALIFDEVKTLGFELYECNIVLIDRDTHEITLWGPGWEDVKLPRSYNIVPWDHPFLNGLLDDFENEVSYRTFELGGKSLQNYFKVLFRDSDFKDAPQEYKDTLRDLDQVYGSHAMMTYGALEVVGAEPLPEDKAEILKRFARIVDFTYTRFEDVKQAEDQAREAEIQLALERVRARTMAMQHSDELNEASQVLDEQVRSLGIRTWGSAFHVYADDPEGDYEWFSSREGTLPFYKTPRDNFFLKFYKKGQKGESFHVEEFIGEDCKDHYEYLMSLPVLGDALQEIVNAGGSLPDTQYDHVAFFKYGFLLFITYEPVPEAHDIFKRFANVFEQAYTRFLDLKKAEKLALETARQSSLDRIRAEIGSMRNSEDLQQITPIIWDELKTLEIPFIRCGVFIIDEENGISHTYLSTSQGDPIAAIHLPIEGISLVENAAESWQKQKIYTEHWDKQDFHKWTQTLIDRGFIDSKKKYEAGSAPETLDLHFLPFKHGMLYIGNTEPLSQEKLDLGQSMAKAFSVAYDRYEDFNKLEQAKHKIEEAFRELEAAKDQLVQQEKLASLGQLTAGIAHEIKNPLNFVNNFSDLSIELVDEARDNIKEKLSADSSQLTAILDDIETNLRIIHQHGTRADGIVKSMLQHSRGGSGQMEPTDVNALIKEYANLAFHGMRAGKDPIEVEIDLDLDQNVGEVEMIAEDFSRVILNLCNNAFDAMREKLSENAKGKNEKSPVEGSGEAERSRGVSSTTGYEPKLSIRTQRRDQSITIEIQDNGPGIPDEIIDKILQPFFTTKKGTAGTGLGLSITNDIVKAHGGTLKVETENDKGTELIILLPLNRLPAQN